MIAVGRDGLSGWTSPPRVKVRKVLGGRGWSGELGADGWTREI